MDVLRCLADKDFSPNFLLDFHFQTVALRERGGKKTASQQSLKPDVHASGYKDGWTLPDSVRPSVAAETIRCFVSDVLEKLRTNVHF